ncbi:MAG: HD domain-containing protein [Bdellovibrionales bacterium]|nr:HD domain-containing protein [Bdellovibrionales bacterium]
MDAKDFVSIRVCTLRGDQQINFDAFVQVAGKHILYLRKGDSFEGDRLKRLKAKKLRKMYIRVEEEDSYRTYMTQNIEVAYDKNSSKSIEDRSQIIQGVQQSSAEDVMENPDSKAFYDLALKGSMHFSDFLKNEEQALKQIISIPNEDFSPAHHGVTVSALTMGIARRKGIEDEDTLSLIGLGSLVHDIEHQHSPVPLEKPKDQMTLEEQATYELHPVSGAERVKDLDFYDPLIMKIIKEHEEYIDGTGYPSKMYEKDLDPFAMIAATANGYDKLVSFFGMDPKTALKTLLIDKLGLYSLENLQHLQAVLKQHSVV